MVASAMRRPAATPSSMARRTSCTSPTVKGYLRAAFLGPTLHGHMAHPSPGLVELRVLDGPNLYFTRPAIKLTLDVTPWLDAPEERVERLAARARLKGVEHEQRRPRAGSPR